MNIIYKYTLGLLGFVYFYNDKNAQIDKHLKNAKNQRISELIVENYTFVVIIQLVLLLVYLISVLLILINKLRPLSTKLRNKIYNVSDTFEYSFLLILFYSLAPSTFAFLVANLRLGSDQKALYRVSLAVCAIYLVIFALGFATFLIAYITQKGLKYYSNFKTKLGFLFLGYRETALANLYEMFQLTIIILLGSIFGGLYSNIGAQTNFLLFLQIVQLVGFAYVKPQVSKWDQILEGLEKASWSIIFLLISCMQIFDLRKSFGILQTLGWIVLMWMFIQLMLDFFGSLFLSVKFLSNISSEQNLLFVDRHSFEQIGKHRENNLVEISDQNSFMNDKDSIRSLNQKAFKNKKEKSHSDFPFKKLKERDITNKSSFLEEKIGKQVIKEEIDEFQSGQGSLHESYISKSAESGEKGVKFIN